jgi:hypothetical protein
MDIQLGGIIYLLFYFHAGAFDLGDREKRRGGQRGTQKQKGRICMQLQSYSPRGVQGYLSIEYFVGLVIKRGARRGCQMQRA